MRARERERERERERPRDSRDEWPLVWGCPYIGIGKRKRRVE